jgi:cytochrome c oxidase subunit 3/cytochrome o ubiquinol oxidase subunit 3
MMSNVLADLGATTSVASSAAGPLTTHHSPLTTQQWGLIAFLLSEVALFGTLIVTYIYYLGRDTEGPTPAEMLSLRLVLATTACLLASSGTAHLAERTLERNNQSGFIRWWLATIVLGTAFLVGTGFEWYDLIDRGLTIGRNLFGTTYYTLVGLHALHVTGGVTIMIIVLGLALARQVTSANRAGVGLVAWYWHFVDGVWVVVFTVVYLVGR